MKIALVWKGLLRVTFVSLSLPTLPFPPDRMWMAVIWAFFLSFAHHNPFTPPPPVHRLAQAPSRLSLKWTPISLNWAISWLLGHWWCVTTFTVYFLVEWCKIVTGFFFSPNESTFVSCGLCLRRVRLRPTLPWLLSHFGDSCSVAESVTRYWRVYVAAGSMKTKVGGFVWSSKEAERHTNTESESERVRDRDINLKRQTDRKRQTERETQT